MPTPISQHGTQSREINHKKHEHNELSETEPPHWNTLSPNDTHYSDHKTQESTFESGDEDRTTTSQSSNYDAKDHDKKVTAKYSDDIRRTPYSPKKQKDKISHSTNVSTSAGVRSKDAGRAVVLPSPAITTKKYK